MKIYDVVIVGAGPVGLATALGLRQRGIKNILVIDQTRAFRRVGQTVDLLPNGLKAIRYIDPNAYEAIKKNSPALQNQASKPVPVWAYKDLQGNNVYSNPLNFDDWFEKYGEGRVSVTWYDLQTTLRQLLPEDIIVINNRCIDIQEEDNCVRVDCVSDASVNVNPYAYWEEDNLEAPSQQLETKSYRAKLLVAADGINSTVRKVLYKDTEYSNFAQPEYSEYSAISCLEITDIPNQLDAELTEKYFSEASIISMGNSTLDSRLMFFRRGNNQVGYMLHAALPLEELNKKSGSSLVEIASQNLEKVGFPPELQQLVSLSSATKIQKRPYYIHRTTDDSIWSKGRTVLVGDAAHGMPPFMAQGANQGFEDALAITTQITNIAQNNNWDNIPAITQCFQTYEKYRNPFIVYIQGATLTRFPQTSKKLSQEYAQAVYCRNFDSAIGVML